MNPHLIYPRPGDKATVYLKNVITNPAIQVGDFTMYHDFRNDPRAFQENNVLYHYPVNGDRLVMGKFCSIACGAVFLFTSCICTTHVLSGTVFRGVLFSKQPRWICDIRLTCRKYVDTHIITVVRYLSGTRKIRKITTR